MKESTWNECLESNNAISITPDKAKSNSLTETAEGRIEFLSKIIIREENANYIFESIYTSILEILHSKLILKGFKVQNHLCLGYYLRDILKREDLFRTFDDLRYKRNSLTYYGRRMDFNTAKEAITNAKELIKILES